MECIDTLAIICSYLEKRDVIQFSDVSCMWQEAAAFWLTDSERQYATGVLRASHVELSPPCKIIRLSFYEKDGSLMVLCWSGDCSDLQDDAECFLYIHETMPDGMRQERRVELPTCFSHSKAQTRFEGQRYLCCTSRDGSIVAFDCAVETELELPFGTDGFYASSDGARFIIDHDRSIHYCSADCCVRWWWESHQPMESRHLRGRRQLCAAPPASSTLRSAIVLDNAMMCCAVGSSSAAWRSCWVGQHSAIMAHEGGVSVFAESLSTQGGEKVTHLPLPELAPIWGSLVHSSCSDVSSSVLLREGRARCDEYVFLDCSKQTLRIVECVQPTGMSTSHPVLGTFTNTFTELIELSNFFPVSARALIKEVRIVVPRAMYAIFIHAQAQHLDRVLFCSRDLSMSRWITVSNHTARLLVPSKQALITTAGSPFPGTYTQLPLLEAAEGGLGTVYYFSSEVAPKEQFAGVHVPLCDLEAQWEAAHQSSTLNGVEVLSWLAFGVVSASLVWTVSALCYNGWWLHLQLLFWGKLH